MIMHASQQRCFFREKPNPLRASFIKPSRAARCQPCPTLASAAGGRAKIEPQPLPSAWVANCLEGAQRSAVLINGRHYIPLTEAQRWFEAGQHEGEAEFADKLSAALEQRGRVQVDMEHLAEEAMREHDEYEQGMRRLLNYALTLEAELEHMQGGMQEASQEAAHETEGKLLMQYQQLLIDYEKAHEAETHAIEMGLRGQVQHLEKMLRAAHVAKKAWRDRALQVEEQFAQLRSLIQVGLKQASEVAQWRLATEAQTADAPHPHTFSSAAAGEDQGPEQAPPPPQTNARIRSAESVSSADADVATAHHAPASSALEARHKGKGGRKKAGRGSSPEPRIEMHMV